MEDFAVNFVIDKGLHARTLRYALRPFTLVAATTRPGMLTSPLRERFGIFHHLDFYSDEELCRIILRSASILGASVERPGAEEIARRSRGTPRIANRLLRRVRDYAQVKGDGVLTAIIEQYGGGPVGIEAVAATINDEAETLAEMVEPYLLKIGFIVRSPNGRRATAGAYSHLGYPAPAGHGGQGQLPL
jgi:Holliday junction DNA helicase RuvB